MTLLVNAIESIKMGIEDYEMVNKNPHRRISCTRNLFAGVLLLFKHYLHEIDPDLIYSNNKQKEKNKTLNYGSLKQNLDKRGVDINWSKLEHIHEIRNDMEHKYCNANPLIISGLLVEIFNVINDFIRKYLNLDPIELFEQDVWAILVDLETVYEKEKQNCIQYFDNNKYINNRILELFKKNTCLNCGFDLIQPISKGVDANETRYKCLSCFNEIDYEECVISAIDRYVDEYQRRNSIFGNPYEEIFCTCPECWTNCYSIEDQICFNCKFEAIQICVICENSLTGDEISFGVKACGYCRNKIEKVMRE